ncbi:MAG TPA: hypothetical protein VEU08_14615 [Vicinamibacterales bacterium]|nr:hypothetical protein [Vicinamibacterales bacterium]
MKEYRVSDVAIDSVQSAQTKAFLQQKLNALAADGWTVEDILQAGDTWFIVSSRALAG